MGRPTESELKHALAKAAEMREHGNDPDFIGKSLLNLNYRFDIWQRVIDATKLYLHSGLNTTEHARLIKTLQETEKLEEKTNQDSDFGLE